MDLKKMLMERYEDGLLYGIDRNFIENGYLLKMEDFSKYYNIPMFNQDGSVNEMRSSVYSCGTSLVAKYSLDDFEPTYFHHYSIITDGTLMFHLNAVYGCFETIIGSMPKYFDVSNINNKDCICYTFGDAFITTEHENSGKEDKPWLNSRISCWIPVKFELIKNME